MYLLWLNDSTLLPPVSMCLCTGHHDCVTAKCISGPSCCYVLCLSCRGSIGHLDILYTDTQVNTCIESVQSCCVYCRVTPILFFEGCSRRTESVHWCKNIESPIFTCCLLLLQVSGSSPGWHVAIPPWPAGRLPQSISWFESMIDFFAWMAKLKHCYRLHA